MSDSSDKQNLEFMESTEAYRRSCAWANELKLQLEKAEREYNTKPLNERAERAKLAVLIDRLRVGYKEAVDRCNQLHQQFSGKLTAKRKTTR